MPRIDELLGIATIAAAGMAIALALEPLPSGTAAHGGARADISEAIVAAVPYDAPIVRLPPIDVTARRSIELNLAASPVRLPNT